MTNTNRPTPKFIFVTGGVVSSLGKGLAAASIGCLLEGHGYTVTLKKFDPYINVDPGTMSPYQHGEVYVTDDGAETDLDLGHYERFIDVELTKLSNVTTGQVYKSVLESERKGKEHLGSTIQVMDWKGSFVWNFKYAGAHHDLRVMPNGHVLLLVHTYCPLARYPAIIAVIPLT